MDLIPDHLSDIPLPLEVVLATKLMSVRDLLALELGTVIKLQRSAGENVDVFVEQQLVAFGEIVVMEDTMGFRVTDLCKEK